MQWIDFDFVFKFFVRLFASMAARGEGTVVAVVVVAARGGAAPESPLRTSPGSPGGGPAARRR